MFFIMWFFFFFLVGRMKQNTINLFPYLPPWEQKLHLFRQHGLRTQYSLVYMLLLLLLFRHSVVSDSLWPHGLQHPRLPCPSLSPSVCSNLCPSSQWCHPTISSSVVPISSCPQSFPESGSFPMSQLFASGGQSIGSSASASVPPMNI